MKDKISVIVPVYNVEEYLDECLVSIVNQTYKNLEILVIDDGSTDNSGKMCDEWATKDKRIKVFHKENGGLSSARNVGLKHATGKWISFVDSDDFIDTTMYEELIKNSIGADLVCCEYFSYKNNSLDKVTFSYDNYDIKYMIRKMFSLGDGTVWNKMYLREKLDNLLFIEDVKAMEDISFFYTYLDKISKINYVHKPLYYFRQREGSIRHVGDPKKLITSIESAYIVNKVFEKYDIFERYYIQCDNICNFYIYRNKIGKNFDYSKYERIIKSYLDNHILRKKIGLQNRIKIIMAVYFTPLYLLLKKIK